MDPYFYTRKKEKKSSRNFGNKISDKNVWTWVRKQSAKKLELKDSYKDSYSSGYLKEKVKMVKTREGTFSSEIHREQSKRQRTAREVANRIERSNGEWSKTFQRISQLGYRRGPMEDYRSWSKNALSVWMALMKWEWNYIRWTVHNLKILIPKLLHFYCHPSWIQIFYLRSYSKISCIVSSVNIRFYVSKHALRQ